MYLILLNCTLKKGQIGKFYVNARFAAIKDKQGSKQTKSPPGTPGGRRPTPASQAREARLSDTTRASTERGS